MKLRFLFLLYPIILHAQTPLKFVDPLIGTAPATTESALKHSEAGSELKGQTFPAVGRPFGMTQWTPETRMSEEKCVSPYYYNDKLITGFRGSHWMSGSCTQDYGSVTVMPFVSSRADTVRKTPVSKYNHSKEKASPDYYSVFLEDYGVLAEMTGSVRSGMLKFSFPKNTAAHLFIRVNSDKKKGQVWIDPSKKEIVGYNPVFRIYQGWGQSAGFSGHFVIQFNQPFSLVKTPENPQQLVVSFGNAKEVVCRIGTSFVSMEGARNNLAKELPGWDFNRFREEATLAWNESLGKLTVSGKSENDKIKFYTALYHSFQLPRVASDVDGRYPGFGGDTLIHKAEGFDYYDDFSMWDTYRCLHPLLTLIEPKRSLDMVKSLVAKAEQGGWIPIFPAWGSYTAAMIGDHVSTMIADAYLRGIRDFDTHKAYFYMRKNAFEVGEPSEYKDGKGRRALDSYLKYGYIPLEDSVWEAFHRREQVSRTLEYSLDDFALLQFARAIGKYDDTTLLEKRSGNYRNVIDPGTGYARGRFADGRWMEPFDPFSKAKYITEGTPFQYTWYVPQDIPGLIKLLGGKDKFLQKLSFFFNENHYWHGNETDHQAAYLFAFAGDSRKTNEWVRKIIDTEYGTGPGGLSGNEDAGQMSAWLVCSMMGFYPVCPGKPEFVLGYPSFSEIRIKSDKNQSALIIKSEQAKNTSAVFNVPEYNGIPLTDGVIKQAQMNAGGTLQFFNPN